MQLFGKKQSGKVLRPVVKSRGLRQQRFQERAITALRADCCFLDQDPPLRELQAQVLASIALLAKNDIAASVQ